jgi:hypothetical protein
MTSHMQHCLGERWNDMPLSLQKHYDNDVHQKSTETSHLTINYPWFMQWPLSLLRLMGALINRRGKNIKTTVEKHMDNGTQHWHREVHFEDGKMIEFDSKVTLGKNQTLIEHTNRFLALKMKPEFKDNRLCYESCGYQLSLGQLKVPIPEWLALGHASIVETAVDDECFDMDFRLKHWLFGEIFSYKGRFWVE